MIKGFTTCRKGRLCAILVLVLIFQILDHVSACSEATIVDQSGVTIGQGTLIINPKSSRLSLNQAKALFNQAAGKYKSFIPARARGCFTRSLTNSLLTLSISSLSASAVKTGDVFDICACVHANQMHAKLVKTASSVPAPSRPTPAGAAPKRKREVSGAENEPCNVKIARHAQNTSQYDFGSPGPSAPAPAAATAGTSAPVGAKRAAPRPRPRKVIPNKRISGEVTPTEVRYLFIYQ